MSVVLLITTVVVVICVCRSVLIQRANLRRAVQTGVATSDPETTPVIMANIKNNKSPAFNPSAAYGGYATHAGNITTPSYPAPTAGYTPADY